MDKLRPLAITAGSDNSYCVRFKTSTDEVEFKFTIENETIADQPIRTLGWEPEYSKLVEGDPAALILNQAIFKLHDARNFNY